MDFSRHSDVILSEIRRVTAAVEERAAAQFADAVVSARRVFVVGCGRSGLVARAFAMRLFHLGRAAFVVGDTTTPPIGAGDLLVICSGTGTKQTLLSYAEQARRSGALCAAITAASDSPLASAADVVVELRAGGSRQFGGSLFEQSLLVFFDALVMALTARCGTDHEEMAARHANLE